MAYLNQIVVMIFSHFPDHEDVDQERARKRLLQPILHQDAESRARIRARRAVTDVDPETGLDEVYRPQLRALAGRGARPPLRCVDDNWVPVRYIIIMRVFIITFVLSITSSLGGCQGGDELSIEEFEAMVDEAGACEPDESCVIVDTYCCARAVNADQASMIRDANERLPSDAEAECLADCVDPGQLVAVCTAGRCMLDDGPDDGFCGFSTQGACTVDADCMTGGCSGQVCQSAAEDPVITTCEWRACYDDEAYGLGCGCVAGQCVWH